MTDTRFQQAAVIGTGMMGPGIAVSVALHGVGAAIISRSREGAAAGLAKAHELLGILAENGLAEPDAVAWAKEHISATDDLDQAVAAADIVFESAPEDLVFKQDLFARLDAVAKPDAVLTTNTSGLSINAVVEKCQRPERALTAHFWNPPYLMRLVELVPNDKTDPQVLADTKALLERCGKIAVVLRKDRPGQLGNRLQHALVREAIHIIAEGIATAEDVDLAVKAGFGLRFPAYGLLEHQDACGMDLVYAIQDYVNRDLNSEPSAHPMLKEMLDRGDLGVKSGKGFYDWSKKDWNEVRERRDRFILEFLKSDFAK